MMRKFKLFSVFVLLALALSAGSSVALANEPRPEGSFDEGSLRISLTAIGKALLVAQNQILVSGNVKGTLENDPLSPLYQAVIQERIADILSRRDYLANHETAYTGFHTTLTMQAFQRTEDTATLEASEHTALDLVVADGDPLAPKTTEYGLDHLFTFVYTGDQWQLTSDQLLNVPGPVPPKEGSVPVPDDVLPSRLTSVDFPEDEHDKGQFDSGVFPNASLNRQAIVDYAYEYWGPTESDYNSEYRSFDLDCTNFVSQAVDAGGWPHVSGWYRSTDAWWYNLANQTWTWVNAHYWWWFTHDRPRGDLVPVGDLEPGDILQIDFDKDGYLDHSMIVTFKDGQGTVCLTYHTTNTKDRSIIDIQNQYPNANYYGWHLLSSYN